jgi:pentapeptide MXKDX repeat protein
MRKIVVAACCVAFMGSISVASAQTTGPESQQTVMKSSNMDSQAKMKKSKMKKGMMKSGDGMSGNGMSSGGMNKGGGMSK